MINPYGFHKERHCSRVKAFIFADDAPRIEYGRTRREGTCAYSGNKWELKVSGLLASRAGPGISADLLPSISKLLRLHDQANRLSRELVVATELYYDELTDRDLTGSGKKWGERGLRIATAFFYKDTSIKTLGGITRTCRTIPDFLSRGFSAGYMRSCKDEIKTMSLHAGLKQAFPQRTALLVLDKNISSVALHESVGHPLEAESIMLKGNYIRPFVNSGRTVMNDRFIVYDDPGLSDWGTVRRDAYGDPRRKLEIIRDGCIKNIYSDRLSSATLETSGNPGSARHEFMSGIPRSRISALVLEDREYLRIPERMGILKTMRHLMLSYGVGNDEIVLLEGCSGGEGDLLKGYFRAIPHRGWIYRKNKLFALPVKSFEGSMLVFLSALRAGAGELTQGDSSYCSKFGQDVPVSSLTHKYLILASENGLDIK